MIILENLVSPASNQYLEGARAFSSTVFSMYHAVYIRDGPLNDYDAYQIYSAGESFN